MIGRLKGTVIEKGADFIIVDVAGVGYLVQPPPSALKKFEVGKEYTLFTRCRYTEEEAFIYGFLQREELTLFEALTAVSGVGPKLGLNLLSAFTPAEIYRAVEEENVDLLSSVPKVGPKIASKIILDLKGKLSFTDGTGAFPQAVNMLCSLGLTRSEAIAKLRGLSPGLTVEEMIKQALQK